MRYLILKRDIMYDVVISGAGPVGLTLALALGRAKKSVLLLEKKAAFDEHSRAPAIWPRTQEVLHELGVRERLAARGMLVKEFRLWDADEERMMLRLPLEDLRGETPFPELLILPQDRTERLLFEALGECPSVETRFSAEVTELTQTADRVSVQYREHGETRMVEAAYLAGCDGAHSRVRQVMGLELRGKTYGLQIALADVELPQDRDLPFPRFSVGRQFSVGIRLDGRLWRLILPYPENGTTLLDDRIASAVKSLFHAGEYRLAWKSEFRLHRRICETFLLGRVALAGDAAHLNSPVGGQGMNSGIQDAAFLGKALIGAFDENDPLMLANYDQVRRGAVGGGVNPFTDALTRILLFQGGRHLKTLLRGASHVLKVRPWRRALLRRMAMVPEKV